MKCGDIRSAFLQGRDLKRNIFVKPPEEAGVPDGYLWKLRKSVYGTADGGRHFYLKLRDEAENLKMNTLDGDLSVFYKVRDNKLEGIIGIHVDDLIFA